MLENRSSGILLHMSSLPSKFGIGDLGPQAYHFVDLLAKNYQSYWQILPLNPTESQHGNSPYHSCSSFAGNPLLISPELLYQEGLINEKELKGCFLPEKESVDYKSVYINKNKLFDKAYTVFNKKIKLKKIFDIFCKEQKFWLDDYALFRVIMKKYPLKQWNKWPDGLKNREPQAVFQIEKEMHDKIKKQKFIQFLFFYQWNSLKKYCQGKKIKIIGDLPIYVTYHSADVWSYPDLFKLDEDMKPLFKSGVPPDYFSKTGQLWGNPVYNWSAQNKQDFNWWIKRIEHNLKMVDLLRIDHFRGLVAYWEIPANEKTAINGNWVTGGGEIFFQMLKQKFPDLPFIAEDLGVITEDVIQVIKQLGLPGMRVLLFAFDRKKFPHNIHLPHNFKNNCVAYTGTHDNNTVQGWLQKEIGQKEKYLLKKYLNKNIRIKNAHWELIKLAQASVAYLAIIPVQDILGLGENARMNHPAKENHNWQWKLSIKQLSEMKDNCLPRLKELTQIYGREKNRTLTI